MLTFGVQGLYRWLVTDEQFDLLQLYPNVVLGKYVAITSFDSGELVLSEKELAAGWQSRGGIAYSPQVYQPEEIPSAGWDEWYIFAESVDLGMSHLAENIFEPQEQGHVNVFVNYGFALHPPERANLSDLFWQQIERVRPESYVADNDFLTFVTMNQALFSSVVDALKGVSPKG